MENDEIEESQHVDDEGGASISHMEYSLASNIREMLETVGPHLSSESCIYRVHNTLRKLNESAYTPKLVSIGPFHYGKVGLETMEKFKHACLKKILGRRGVSSLEEILIYIKEQEERVRDCYAESIELSNDEFVKMILLDTSFIIEFFFSRRIAQEVEDEIYHVFSKPWVTNCILYDLLLLENQLPFFALEGSYNLLFPSNKFNNKSSFLLLARTFPNYYSNIQEISPSVQVNHFTDLQRTFMRPSSPRLPPKEAKSNRLSYSAMELHRAGVKFKVSSSKCLFDIQFSNGVLQIPNFIFADNTESFMRNLMALEQCHYPVNTYICDYIILMDTLIDTDKDVELLVQNGIITNHLGGNDVLATLINNLGTGIIYDYNKSFFCGLCEGLTEYYKNPWNSWKATLTRDYLSTPWRIASTVAAVILLVLTFLQTVNSFVSL